MSHLDIIGTDAFQQSISSADKISIVDFWAEWCGPCRMLAPVLHQLADEYADKVQLIKINVDNPENQQLAMDYQISSIPRVIFFHNGEKIEDFVGVQSPEAVQQLIENNLGRVEK